LKRTNLRITPGSGNIFLDLGFPPHEAAVMMLRCELAEALRQWMEREDLTQAQAAQRLGIAQPRISEIARNRGRNSRSTTSWASARKPVCRLR
jgi:predicted XRE-type DNA-binding protein